MLWVPIASDKNPQCLFSSRNREISEVLCFENVSYLTLSTLGKIFSRRHIEIFFLFFPENRI